MRKKSALVKKTAVSFLKFPLIQPFRTALGDHNALENILFALELSDGTRGYGEAAVASHITGESLKGTFSNLRKIGESLIGRDAFDYLKISSQLHKQLPDNKSALAAVEMALLDALTKQRQIPWWKFFGNRCALLKTDVTIVIADLRETESSVKKFYRQGFRTFKVKIGRDMDLDFKRVLAVKRLAPHCAFYLDANQGYSAKEMLKFLKSLGRAALRPALLEQPVARGDWEGLKHISRATRIPVCADESIRSLSDAVRAIKEKVAPVINIKFMKFGVFEAHKITLLCKAEGIDLMMGGMMETSLAMTAAAHFAAGLGGFKYIDLDTPFFIKKGLRGNPYLSSDGRYDLRKAKYGIGLQKVKRVL